MPYPRGVMGSDFEMTVSNVFVLAGRGIVVAGETVRGEFRNGDVAQIWHRDQLLGHSVAFVEMHSRPGTVALILTHPNVQVEPGYIVRGASATAPADEPASTSGSVAPDSYPWSAARNHSSGVSHRRGTR